MTTENKHTAGSRLNRSDLFAVANPMMTINGGCAGYEIIKRGTASECIIQPAKRGQVIIRDDESQDEVAWERDGRWERDDESIFLANAELTHHEADPNPPIN